MKHCLNCGSLLKDGAKFCCECGKPVPQGRVCHHCGAIVDEGDMFCHKCGNRLEPPKITVKTDSLQKTCPKCGTLLDGKDVYCPNCGHSAVKKHLSPLKKGNQLFEKKSQNDGLSWLFDLWNILGYIIFFLILYIILRVLLHG